MPRYVRLCATQPAAIHFCLMLRLTLRILFGESQSELLQQLFHRHVMVRRNWFQDTFDERANLQGLCLGIVT